MFYLCRKEEVPEWKSMYLRRDQIYNALAILKTFPPKIDSNIFKKYLEINSYYWETLELEIEKIEAFLFYLNSKLTYEIMFQKNVLQNLYLFPEMKTETSLWTVKRSLLSIYHEARVAIIFLNTNKRRIYFLAKSFRQNIPDLFAKNSIHRIEKTEFHADAMSDKEFRELKTRVEDQYNDVHYVSKGGPDELYQIKKEFICISNDMLEKHALKVFMWILLMICFLIYLCFYSEIINYYPIDRQLNYIFPVFRGAFLFNIYFWILIGDIFIWSIFEVNYSLLLGFHSRSELPKLIMDVFYFTLITIFSFLIYATHHYLTSQFDSTFDIMGNIYAAIPWSVLLVYLLFPSKKFCNWEGRVYFFEFWKSIIFFWRKPVPLKLIWFSDQLISLVKPIQDIEYSLCYFFSLPQSKENECLDSRRISNTLVVYTFVLGIRMTQEMRRIYDDGSIIRSPSTRNFIKYFLTLATSYLGYFSIYDYVFYAWIGVAIFSTLYAYTWDLLFDFGIQNILDPFTELGYQKRSVYLLGFGVNLFLRFMWILSFSEQSVRKLSFWQVYSLSIALFEIIRRGLWNLLKIEFDQRKNNRNLKVSSDIPHADENYYKKDLKIKGKIEKIELNLTETKLIDVGTKPGSLDHSQREFASTNFDLDIYDPEKSEIITPEVLAKLLQNKKEAFDRAVNLRNKSREKYLKAPKFSPMKN